ncbi:hypothetical protein HRG_002330 [Hirsutella rhossiliensis]|uniref:Uncharacterized protein n=1 Tax=Hirsutella rhossiliensis TaxID=111463 RepID=A0A9P8SN86_9HYPO|nr:uncharacterized protein HRG_02330 [Hirsutella rhossiliensis]KAH0966921.1 hypothetical protein HRG_02330 [Hirsutella rhossiliensis]
MRRLKEKQLERLALKEKAQIIGKYGPLSVYDTRVRVAKDEYNRRAAREDEDCRLRRKDARAEAAFLRRWIRDVRAVVRNSITKTTIKRAWQQGGWSKADRRAHLDHTEWLCDRYLMLRQLRDIRGDSFIAGPCAWPQDFNDEIVRDSITFMLQEATDGAASRRALAQEADGLEFTAIDADGDGRKEDEVNDTIVCASWRGDDEIPDN